MASPYYAPTHLRSLLPMLQASVIPQGEIELLLFDSIHARNLQRERGLSEREARVLAKVGDHPDIPARAFLDNDELYHHCYIGGDRLQALLTLLIKQGESLRYRGACYLNPKQFIITRCDYWLKHPFVQSYWIPKIKKMLTPSNPHYRPDYFDALVESLLAHYYREAKQHLGGKQGAIATVDRQSVEAFVLYYLQERTSHVTSPPMPGLSERITYLIEDVVVLIAAMTHSHAPEACLYNNHRPLFASNPFLAKTLEIIIAPRRENKTLPQLIDAGTKIRHQVYDMDKLLDDLDNPPEGSNVDFLLLPACSNPGFFDRYQSRQKQASLKQKSQLVSNPHRMFAPRTSVPESKQALTNLLDNLLGTDKTSPPRA